ncbi:hypothetical protein HYV49_00115 [Candidatus Pacearchaeota archaeon]|nr:hypothetical protein [Candidatus Pacearchaeota archaeon]
MRKKGFLLGETAVTVIIAVIVIIGLVYFIYVLYGLFSGESKSVQADSTLKEFISVLQELEKREQKSIQFIFLNPDGWLVAFPFSLRQGKFIPPPSICKDKCICLCEDEDCVRVLACQDVKYEVADSDKLSAYFEIPRGGVEYNVEFFELDKKYIMTRK